ncbi:uncharacterized protein LOC107796069 [Nicotiana tabacum]|uniref:UPF0690 protein C1orf52 homolog n=1 Tax=Nicotiana tabacum TaxID=4097 RepID=A0A1S4AC76_TOBAC|nr:PREDICTED: UPF0690 protein C1orf52 homolog [Nicotiana tabacum]XP_033509037.1 UPF0690 protein C1orf52 homolog [Nicotiana tomentosiformis]
MKRTMPWSDEEDDTSSDESSTLDTDTEDNLGFTKIDPKLSTTSKSSKDKSSQAEFAKRKSKAVDFEALSRHGYKGGLSVLKVPPPKEPDQEQNWSWSKGKETREKEKEETYQERQKTRAALQEAEELVHARTQKERKNFSFSQKEKRKRDLGQASRGKSYVEEEKRLLRDNGVYSGFDA